MSHTVYIIYSEKLNRYYIGETTDLKERILIHNDIIRNTNSTKSGIPWTLYWCIYVENKVLGKKIEQHLKNMKSVKYFQNLKQYPEIAQKLINKYNC